ncbi:ABC transporter permease [Occallatibacter savannae]|uniref:ABC transporter permease n=1 Tax=Occallatibacter savannae TaxID=1002691 RepID=UPI000D6904A6|nr:ABC transporter permease [Occallatibacter savannae]
MKRLRRAALAFLAIVVLASLLAGVFAPASYDFQFREVSNAACSTHHWLGTDALGRDRFSRLLFGTRVSLLLAPAAALISTLLAALIGGVAGYIGGKVQRTLMAATDLSMAMPWMFLLITVRAMLPLNTGPAASVVITFAVLGLLGWPAAARVVCADARRLIESDFILHARAAGCSEACIFRRQFLPNLRPVLMAQFWISIPVFILAEANLGILGLGVAEPLPSWGGLLQELQGLAATSGRPWQFAPILLLIATVSCFHLAIERKESEA